MRDFVRVFEATKISSSDSDSHRNSSGVHAISIPPAIARCCRWREFPSSRPFCFTFNAPAGRARGGSCAKRARIFRKRSRAASASIVSRSRPCSMMVNSSIKPSNSEIRCVETNTVRSAGIAGLIRADDGLDEFAADDGVEAGGRLVEHEQFRFGTNRADERELRALAFGEVAGFLVRDRAGSVSANRLRCRGSNVCGTRRDIPACRARSSTDKTRPCPAHRRAAISRRLHLRCGSRPNTRTVPESGRSRFSRHLMVVVLPAPLRPKKP